MSTHALITRGITRAMYVTLPFTEIQDSLRSPNCSERSLRMRNISCYPIYHNKAGEMLVRRRNSGGIQGHFFSFCFLSRMSRVNVLIVGKNISVPYSHNMAVSSVISASIKKAGVQVSQSDSFALYYNNKLIDNSFTLRRAGIPQGGTVSVRKQKGKRKQESKIALQLPTSPVKRLFATLPVQSTLWDILLHFEAEIGSNIVSAADEAFSYPQLTFMNRKFTSPDELCSNTISSLGAKDGVFRLSFGAQTGKTPRELDLLPSASDDMDVSDDSTENSSKIDQKQDNSITSDSEKHTKEKRNPEGNATVGPSAAANSPIYTEPYHETNKVPEEPAEKESQAGRRKNVRKPLEERKLCYFSLQSSKSTKTTSKY